MSKVKCAMCSKVFTDEEKLAVHMGAQHKGFEADAELDVVARAAIFDFLTNDGKDTGLREKAKQANAYRSTEARREATQNNRETNAMLMARSLSESREEFEKYLRIALPSAPVFKRLPGKPN